MEIRIGFLVIKRIELELGLPGMLSSGRCVIRKAARSISSSLLSASDGPWNAAITCSAPVNAEMRLVAGWVSSEVIIAVLTETESRTSIALGQSS